jgi:hypothetical protein
MERGADLLEIGNVYYIYLFSMIMLLRHTRQ